MSLRLLGVWILFWGRLIDETLAALLEKVEMPLIKCPESDCGFEKISSTADKCPQCGNTNFRRPSGKTMSGRCHDCGGVGRIPAGYRDSYSDCSSCKGTKVTRYFQVENLQTGTYEWWYTQYGTDYHKFDDSDAHFYRRT